MDKILGATKRKSPGFEGILLELYCEKATFSRSFMIPEDFLRILESGKRVNCETDNTDKLWIAMGHLYYYYDTGDPDISYGKIPYSEFLAMLMLGE
jgi:hypothetical protein